MSWIFQLVIPKDVAISHLGKGDGIKPKTKTREENPTIPNSVVEDENDDEEESLPRRMRDAVVARLRSDVIVCFLVAVVVFGVYALF